MIKFQSNKLQIKTKVIIAFVLLFINFFGFAQSIPRDTNAVEFIGALEEEDFIPEDFTGIVKYRKKSNEGAASYKGIRIINRASNNSIATDIIIPPVEYNALEKDTLYKIGQTKYIRQYYKGERTGTYFFYNDGAVRSLYCFFAKGGKWNTLESTSKNKTINVVYYANFISFYRNGNVAYIQYPNSSGNARNIEMFYENHNIAFKYTIENDLYQGTMTTFHPNEKVKQIAMTKDNQINGYVLTYNENGHLDKVEYYEKNILFPEVDSLKFNNQFIILKYSANEHNRSIDQKNSLAKTEENLKKTEEEKRRKEEELRHQQEEIKRNQLELELLAKDKAVSALTIKAKEAELLKNMLLANEKKKEIERLNQQKLIDELSIKNKESEIAKKNIEAENKQKQIHGLEKEKELSNENLKQQKFIQKLMIAGSGLLGVFLIFVFFSLAKSRKANKLIAAQKTEVEKQKIIAEKQKDIAEEQKHLLQEKQTEIIESITYAKRLQEAILPPPAFINSFIPSNFILYKPKDIVAGDFYWAENIGDLFFIAAADSTGHGVPGAMVSVVCSNALNRTVKEFNLTETGKILDKTKELVVATFEKSTSEVKDGMDISLLCIDTKNKKVFWSGANNPLWYIHNGELKEIKADKQPIGKTDKVNLFTTHEIEFKENTSFYLFTDGFADQFGGPNGKKFKYKPFAEILVQNVNKTPSEQSAILAEKFEAWKGELEQVDDVCVIGIRI